MSEMPSQRFLDAVARGEVTKGGMAEAGWFEIGTLADDGPMFIASQPDDEKKDERWV